MTRRRSRTTNWDATRTSTGRSVLSEELLAGASCVVTGATSGIGLEVVVALAGRGARVTGVGRDRDRCRRAEGVLLRRLPAARVDFETANLASMAEVKSLAVRLRERSPSLDVLINNAATFSSRRVLTDDGLELQFAVNYLASFGLTVGLLPALVNRSVGRVIYVGSGSHQIGRIRWDNLSLSHCYRPLRAYGQSKLAGTLFSYELATRYAGALAVAVADPGLTNTELGLKRTGPVARLIWTRRRRYGSEPSIPAAEIADLVGDPSLLERSGLCWKAGKVAVTSAESYDPESARRLWTLSEGLFDEKRARALRERKSIFVPE